MTENPVENPELSEIEFGDYDLPDEVAPVEPEEALPYPDTQEEHDPEAPADAVRDAVTRSPSTVVATVTPAEAIARAREWSRERRNFGLGHCLIVVRTYFNVSSKYGSASLCWAAADHKHFVSSGRNVPRGAPVYWTGGTHGYGHIALSIGGGLCYSTDWREAGKIDIARIDDITSHWGLHLAGYANEINDVTVWQPATAADTVSLKNLHYGKRSEDARQLKRRLKKKGYTGFLVSSNRFGSGLRKAYAKYQRHLGYSGKDANGIPGPVSLKKLGFNVKP